MEITIIVPGVPQAQKRHMARQQLRKGARGIDWTDARTGKTHKLYRRDDFWLQMYDPSAKAKAGFAAIARLKAEPRLLSGPLVVGIVCKMPRPKDHFGTGRNAHTLKDKAPFYHTTKPDADNLAKFVIDALTGTYWKDDRSIVLLQISKSYVTETEPLPRTEVKIQQLSDE